jgi:hypothetical protein
MIAHDRQGTVGRQIEPDLVPGRFAEYSSYLAQAVHSLPNNRLTPVFATQNARGNATLAGTGGRSKRSSLTNTASGDAPRRRAGG